MVRRSTINKCDTNNIKIMSWNINDHMDKIEGPKIDNPEFTNVLKASDIFLLQETKGDIKIPNYKCFNKLRVGSRSGGLCIGVNRNILKFTNDVKINASYQDIQVLKISKNLTNTPHDLFIVNTYDSPPNSSYKSTQRKKGDESTTIDNLEDVLSCIDSTYILLAGDFNARTGNESATTTSRTDDVVEDLIADTFIINSHPMTVNTRYSKDVVINDRGRKLLSFLSDSNMEILNGCTMGDITGDFTCHRYNGSSVVDYMLASHHLRQSIKQFNVVRFTTFSDHCPTSCVINSSIRGSSSTDLPKLEDNPLGFRWKSTREHGDPTDSAYLFKNEQNSEIIKSKIDDIAQTSASCSTVDDVNHLNTKLISLFTDIANTTLVKKRRPPNYRNKNVWYDNTCRNVKRKLSQVAKKFNKIPEKEELRNLYHASKRSYRNLVRRKKRKFHYDLNANIEEGKGINWKRLKALKSTQREEDRLDFHDLANFYEFFKKLYSQNSLSKQRTKVMEAETAYLQSQLEDDDTEHLGYSILNDQIEIDELTAAIAKLKTGKAAGEDGLMNEFFINSNNNLRNAILNVMNVCLNNGVYPWNSTVITLLHKKGDRYDPNNYRAIAIGSNLGKLFSGILLNRLICFKNLVKPEHPSQLGFCKNAQTADHVLTLQTCINKYVGNKNKKGRLFTCFVDYQKAFDTVCREALLFKLSQLGVAGRYFDCLSYMYKNSNTKLKLLNKLSEAIDVSIGTEQGHPLSPELFKCFLADLSYQLDNAIGVDAPTLDGVRITHLLWADDLVLTALNRESLQKLLNVLHEYCIGWGLTVNIPKTAVLVFNKSGKLLKDSKGFRLGDTTIESTQRYCYLGIIFTASGSLNAAQEHLKTKGMRAYFALKTMIDMDGLSVNAILKLFDALILPIISYGCQVWAPFTKIVKELCNSLNPLAEHETQRFLRKLATDPIEKVHLKYLKWLLGLHKKSSNLACWGDTGRHPLVTTITKHIFNYYNRLEDMVAAGSNALVCRAFIEQRTLQLNWFTNVNSVRAKLAPITTDNGSSNINLTTPTSLTSNFRVLFESTWSRAVMSQSKLSFYSKVKKHLSTNIILTTKISQLENL